MTGPSGDIGTSDTWPCCFWVIGLDSFVFEADPFCLHLFAGVWSVVESFEVRERFRGVWSWILKFLLLRLPDWLYVLTWIFECFQLETTSSLLLAMTGNLLGVSVGSNHSTEEQYLCFDWSRLLRQCLSISVQIAARQRRLWPTPSFHESDDAWFDSVHSVGLFWQPS